MSVYKGYRLRRFFEAAETRRVDIAVCGDSNQGQATTPYGSHWAAYATVLKERYGCYADRLQTHVAYQSHSATVFGSSAGVRLDNFVDTGGDAFLNNRHFTDSTIEGIAGSGWLGRYARLPAATNCPTAGNITGNGPIIAGSTNNAAALLGDIVTNGFRMNFSLWWPSGSTGVCRPTVRESLTLNVLGPASNQDWSLATGPLYTPVADAINDGYIDVAGGGTNTRSFQLNRINVNNASGQLALTYYRAELTSVTAGCSVSVPHFAGGKSLRFLAKSLAGANTLAIQELLRQLCRLQTGDKMLLWKFQHKGNDCDDTGASWEWDGAAGAATGAASNTADGYANNLRTCMGYITAAWVALGNDIDNLFFLDALYHPQASEPYATLIPIFEGAARTVAKETEFRRLAVVNGSDLISASTMSANSWYANGGADTAHLSSAGFYGLAELELDAIEASIADDLRETLTFTGLDGGEDFIVLGPLPAADSNRYRINLVLSTDGSGIPGADYYNLSMGGALCESNVDSQANMDAGESIWGKANGFYDATTDVYSPAPYIVVGRRVTYTVPIPEFGSGERYVVLAFNPTTAGGGDPNPVITAFISTAASDATPPLASYWEFSWVLPATTIGFVNVGPFTWFPGARLIIDANTDANTANFTVGAVSTASSDEDQTAFDAGSPIVLASAKSARLGESRRFEWAIPEFSGSQYILVRYEASDEPTATAHVSLNVTVDTVHNEEFRRKWHRRPAP